MIISCSKECIIMCRLQVEYVVSWNLLWKTSWLKLLYSLILCTPRYHGGQLPIHFFAWEIRRVYTITPWEESQSFSCQGKKWFRSQLLHGLQYDIVARERKIPTSANCRGNSIEQSCTDRIPRNLFKYSLSLTPPQWRSTFSKIFVLSWRGDDICEKHLPILISFRDKTPFHLHLQTGKPCRNSREQDKCLQV